MQSRCSYLSLFLLVVPMILISCAMKPAPDQEREKQTLKPRKGVVVFQSPSSGSLEGSATQVLVPSDTDGSQTIVIGSASFYDWMEEVKKILAKEKRENINQACIKLGKIAQTEPEALDIDYKVDMECASVPQGGPSHTDPSPIDDIDSWVLCKKADSGPGSSGPGGDPSGGPEGDSGGGQGGDDSGSGSATVDSLTEILCTPAVGAQPGVDPRLVYPAPDQVEAVVANLASCIEDFCPFEIVLGTPDPGNPTDPIDPSPDDPEDLSPVIKEKLMCDKFRGLCEPDVTLISKNDLAKGDEQSEDIKDSEEWEECDGVQDIQGTKMQEVCSVGNVGDDDSDWKECAPVTSPDGNVSVECVTHLANPDEENGEFEWSVTVNPNGERGRDADSNDMKNAQSDSEWLLGFSYDQKNCESKGQSAVGQRITTQLKCK
ncbi:MAG: hypothetical protein DHS20C13_07010 [Thermodesulfobacteriota bacterium]|nr:MAG: hypothetical protein DHS20C13_07010 [Thermodesulfobacteriota bacterium]